MKEKGKKPKRAVESERGKRKETHIGCATRMGEEEKPARAGEPEQERNPQGLWSPSGGNRKKRTRALETEWGKEKETH